MVGVELRVTSPTIALEEVIRSIAADKKALRARVVELEARITELEAEVAWRQGQVGDATVRIRELEEGLRRLMDDPDGRLPETYKVARSLLGDAEHV